LGDDLDDKASFHRLRKSISSVNLRTRSSFSAEAASSTKEGPKSEEKSTEKAISALELQKEVDLHLKVLPDTPFLGTASMQIRLNVIGRLGKNHNVTETIEKTLQSDARGKEMSDKVEVSSSGGTATKLVRRRTSTIDGKTYFDVPDAASEANRDGNW
jgi:hypothetical protein